MNQQPNAIEALSEAIRRLHLNIKGDIAAGRREAIKIVLAYQKELSNACLDRISEGVDEWEEMQREGVDEWEEMQRAISFTFSNSADNMNQQPNAIEALSEAIRREAEQDKQAQDEAYHSLRCAGQPR